MIKSTDTREKLLDTAIELMWQSDYNGVGVNEICKQAGVTKGSFYHYFDSKAELFYEACQHHWQTTKSNLDRIYSPSYGPLEQLENLIAYVISKQEACSTDENPVSACPIFTSGAQCSSAETKVRLAAQELSDKVIRYHSTLVWNLKREGMLEGDPEPERLGRMLLQFIQGLLLYGRVQADLEVVRTDLREGLYRILDLKPAYRRTPSFIGQLPPMGR